MDGHPGTESTIKNYSWEMSLTPTDRVLIALFLVPLISLLLPAVQERIRRILRVNPAWLFAAPAALGGLFVTGVWSHGGGGAHTIPLISLYAFLPTVLAYTAGPGGETYPKTGFRPWVDGAIIVILWLPLELGPGRTLVARPVQGPIFTLAYGVGVNLALFLFLLFRGIPGMKYRFPTGWRDLALPAMGLAVLTPLLMVMGRAFGFIAPFHVPPGLTAATLANRYGLIFLGVALPEEILFRALIQNLLMQRFGFTNTVLAVAAIVFGASHLNNGPFPNWRYLILASFAGFVYGKVFQKSNSVVSSALLHAGVNTLRHTFF